MPARRGDWVYVRLGAQTIGRKAIGRKTIDRKLLVEKTIGRKRQIGRNFFKRKFQV